MFDHESGRATISNTTNFIQCKSKMRFISTKTSYNVAALLKNFFGKFSSMVFPVAQLDNDLISSSSSFGRLAARHLDSQIFENKLCAILAKRYVELGAGPFVSSIWIQPIKVKIT
jgi:hypothetical protein